MGRLIGIPFFFTEKALEEEKNDAANMRKAKMQRKEEGLHGNEDGEIEDEDDPIQICSREAARRIQTQFQNRFIRRSGSSLGPDGKPLLRLPKCKSISLDVKLSDREMVIMDAMAANMRDE